MFVEHKLNNLFVKVINCDVKVRLLFERSTNIQLCQVKEDMRCGISIAHVLIPGVMIYVQGVLTLTTLVGVDHAHI
jgi:hypothetical protein